MNRQTPEAPKNGIELEYDLDEPPQKVWRAISIPAFRENWLPKEALAEPDAIDIKPGEEVRYRLREDIRHFWKAPSPSGSRRMPMAAPACASFMTCPSIPAG